jgi:hypothetical protein
VSSCDANDSRMNPRCRPHTQAKEPGSTVTPYRDATAANADASTTGSDTHKDSPASGTSGTRQAGSCAAISAHR